LKSNVDRPNKNKRKTVSRPKAWQEAEIKIEIPKEI
jgi:hypothetical protein